MQSTIVIELDPFFNTPIFKTNQQNILNLSNPKHNLSTPDLNALTFLTSQTNKTEINDKKSQAK